MIEGANSSDADTEGTNVVALMKGKEQFVFLYDDTSDSLQALLETLSRYADDDDLNFTWYDAALLTEQVIPSRRPDESPSQHRWNT